MTRTSQTLEGIKKRFLAAIEDLEARLDALDADIERTRVEIKEMNPQAKLYFKYVRCGRENCRCRRGEKHGPYAYASYRRADGRVQTVYWGKDPKLPPNYIPHSVYKNFERRLVELREAREALLDRLEWALEILRS